MQGEFLCEIQINYNHDIRTIVIQSAFLNVKYFLLLLKHTCRKFV